MDRDVIGGFKGNFVVRRLTETLTFFRVYARDIGKFLLYSTFPVIIVENFISYYAMTYDLPGEMRHLPIIIHFLYQPIYMGGLIYLISKIVSGETWSVKECLLTGLGCWANLLLVNIISSCLIILGLFALIVPGLYVFARLSLAEFIVVLGRVNCIEALHRSYTVTRGFTWQIIGSCLILSGLLLGLQFLIHLVIISLSLQSLIAFMVSELLVIVLWSTFTILLFRFYDLASRTLRELPDHEFQA